MPEKAKNTCNFFLRHIVLS